MGGSDAWSSWEAIGGIVEHEFCRRGRGSIHEELCFGPGVHAGRHPPPLDTCPCCADKGKRPAAAAADDGEGGGRASKRPAAAAAGDGAGPSGTGGSSVPDPGQSSFTRLGLVQRTIKELQNVLKAWNLPVRTGDRAGGGFGAGLGLFALASSLGCAGASRPRAADAHCGSSYAALVSVCHA